MMSWRQQGITDHRHSTDGRARTFQKSRCNSGFPIDFLKLCCESCTRIARHGSAMETGFV
jgi:hypothetical protein